MPCAPARSTAGSPTSTPCSTASRSVRRQPTAPSSCTASATPSPAAASTPPSTMHFASAWSCRQPHVMNNDLEVRSTGAGTTLRPVHAGDLAAMHGLAQQMSWPHRVEDCAQLLALGAGTVAVDATGRTVGAGLRWSFGRDVGTIGLVLVAPERQGRGIGRALMTALIADSEPRALMLNATAEGLSLYEKLGFVSTGFVRQHQGRLTEAPVFPPAADVPLRRAVSSDHAALCALDAAVFGADRSALIGKLLATGDAWLVDRAGQPAGFAVLRAFGR